MMQRVCLVLFALMMLGSAGVYVFNYPYAHEAFTRLGYPTYLIYPLALAKVLGVTAMVTGYLRDLARAGFLYHLTLALSAHIAAGDGQWAGAVIGLLLLAGTVSWTTVKA